jgi:hypothetical protein
LAICGKRFGHQNQTPPLYGKGRRLSCTVS